MPTKLPAPLRTVVTAARLLWNKGIAILLLAFLVHRWFLTSNGSTPFSEFFYAGILIVGITIVAPIVRLLVFPEAADYAESGGLRRDIGMIPEAANRLRPAPRFTPALVHYWYATAICYAIVTAGAVALQGTGL